MKNTFEQNLDKLNKIVEKLNSGGCALEESISLYEEGKKLLEACEMQLKSAETKIRVAEKVDE